MLSPGDTIINTNQALLDTVWKDVYANGNAEKQFIYFSSWHENKENRGEYIGHLDRIRSLNSGIFKENCKIDEGQIFLCPASNQGTRFTISTISTSAYHHVCRMRPILFSQHEVQDLLFPFWKLLSSKRCCTSSAGAISFIVPSVLKIKQKPFSSSCWKTFQFNLSYISLSFPWSINRSPSKIEAIENSVL